MDPTPRTRFIHQWWDRDPQGIVLDKFNPPLGKRCPNGNVWGHTTDDLFMIERIPGISVVTCYSRSMIKQLNERPIGPGTEPAIPRIRRPYPLLKLAPGVDCQESFRIGFYDEGSDHGDPVAIETDDDENNNDSDVSMTNPAMDVDDDLKEGTSTTTNPVMGVDGDLGNETSMTSSSAMDTHSDPKIKASMATSSTENVDDNLGIKKPDSHTHTKLEEFIPKEFFPDALVVHDPRALSYGKHGSGHTIRPYRAPWIYERLYPDFSKNKSKLEQEWVDGHQEKAAHLNLDSSPLIGIGHHSNVYRAVITLPEGLSARTPTGQVTVVAKTAFPRSEARSLLRNEGKIYDKMPRHMSEEWCGLNMVPPLAAPVPVGPIAPKFYGFYVPTSANGKHWEELSPILLMEECGRPVKPKNLTVEQRYVVSIQVMISFTCFSHRTECYSIFLRLHAQGFIHNSTYVRNIVMQPGPLTRHPSERSLMTPSFRLIDFGRTESLHLKLEETLLSAKSSGLSTEETDKKIAVARHGWGSDRAMEEVAIEKELMIRD
jgi:hypothetical protein